MRRIGFLILALGLWGAALGFAQTQTQVASDTGNRAPCVSSCGNGYGMGPNWTMGGSLTIPANPGFYTQLAWQPDGTNEGETMGYYSAATFSNDQYSQLDCSAMTQGSEYTCGVLLRTNSLGNGYTCSWSDDYIDGHSELYIGKYNHWSYNTGDLVGYYGWNKKPGVIWCGVIGNTFTMKMDGVVVLTTTDSTYPTGNPGLDVGTGADEPAKNWVGGNLTGGVNNSYPVALSDTAIAADVMNSFKNRVARSVYNVTLR